MTELLIPLLKGWTPGGVGIWVLIVLFLLGWWQGLPKVLDAFANRQSKIEERMGKLLEDATVRFEREIAAADKRHDDCMAGQERLLERIGQLEKDRLKDRECIDQQQDTIAGLKRQIVQMQVSAVRTEGTPMSPLIKSAIDQLDAIPEVRR